MTKISFALVFMLATGAMAEDVDVPSAPHIPTDTIIVKKKPKRPNFTCEGKSKCGQMNSCEEAFFYLEKCGIRRLDRDKDGIPCENLCN